MKKYDFIIWDFNGTILNDVDIDIECINVLLNKRGLKAFSNKEEYQNSFCFPIIKWYEELGFDFSSESYDDVALQWVDEYLSREHRAGLCEGASEAFEAFSRKNVKQIIISACEIGMLKRQLDMLGISDKFDDVLGKDDIYASGKEEIALKWRSENEGQALFIGDTDHDLSVANIIGADCVLIANGHQSFERLARLKKENPELRVLRTIRELL